MLYFKSLIFVLSATLFSLLPTALLAENESPAVATTSAKQLALIYNVKEKDTEEKFNKFVTEKMSELGYKLTNPHRRVNDVYKKLYGRTSLDLLSFLPVVNDDVVKPLLNIDPRLAGFNPFNMIIYKKLDEESYHLGHLTAKAIVEITGVEDPEVKEKYIASFGPLDKALAETFGAENASYMTYQRLPEKRTMNFTIAIDPDADVEDFVDEFQETFEDIFAQHEYVIAGFHNYIEDVDEESVLTKFDAFWTYSLCHMKYSSSVFDNDGMRPDASVFAPCTMYMYIPKGSHTLYIGMPLLENVKVALNIKDKMRSEYMDKLDKEIAEILEEEMEAKPIENINPLITKTASASESAVKSAPKSSVAAKEIEIRDKRLAKMYIFEGNIEERYNPFVEKTINKIGFKLTDPHKRVNDHYKEKYGSTNLEVLSFMSIANEKVVKPLFNIDPRIAGFNPFNLLIYKKKSDKVTHVGHLTANAILDMLSITDPKVRDAYTKSMDELDALIQKELGGKEEILEAKGYAADRMMNFEIPFEKGEDIEDVVDAFQEKFEGAFEDKDYIIAGYNNFKETDGEDTIPDFDAFWTYSLCHFKFSYTIFDNEGGRPEGGLFAPCTMYMYIRKGDNKIIVGMPKLVNWQATLGIDDKVRTDFIAKLDREIPEIMKSLGATEIENTNPLLAIIPKSNAVKPESKVVEPLKPGGVKPVVAPKVVTTKAPEKKPLTEPAEKVKKSQPEETGAKGATPSEKVNGYKIKLPEPPKPVAPLNVITVGGSDIHYTPRSENKNPIIFSERRPPDYGESVSETESNEESALPGMPVGGRVSTYLHAPFMDVSRVKENLKKGGFKVIAVTPVNKKGTLTTVTFTSDELLSLAQKKNSGFTGVMRVLINKENNEIAITNPLYFARAYMGEAYDAETVEKVVQKLNNAFKGLQNSDDKLKFTLLPKYRFMEGMPYYKDMVVVAKDKNSKALLDKLKAKGKALKFVQEINPDTYLVGVALGKRTSKFIKKTGYHNAFLLPYPVLIEKGVAKIMEPKYYISVNYPGLKMSNFMKIATVPDAIINDCQKLFK